MKDQKIKIIKLLNQQREYLEKEIQKESDKMGDRRETSYDELRLADELSFVNEAIEKFEKEEYYED